MHRRVDHCLHSEEYILRDERRMSRRVSERWVVMYMDEIGKTKLPERDCETDRRYQQGMTGRVSESCDVMSIGKTG